MPTTTDEINRFTSPAIPINRPRVISLCRLPARQPDAHLQGLRKRVHVLQLVDEAREGGVRTSAQVPVLVLPKEDEATLQPAEAHAKKARLRASGKVPEIGGGTATANQTKAKF